jgi:hypothetical protein
MFICCIFIRLFVSVFSLCGYFCGYFYDVELTDKPQDGEKYVYLLYLCPFVRLCF